mgnify:CR=1 FL=1
MKNIETLMKNGLLNAEVGPNAGYLTVTTKTTAAAVTYTAAEVFGGYIRRDPAGGNRTDVLPTAADFVAYLKNVFGQMGGAVFAYPLAFEFVVQNDADASETITMSVGTGGSLGGNVSGSVTVTIAQNNSRRFSLQFTSTTPGSESYVLRNLGGYTT